MKSLFSLIAGLVLVLLLSGCIHNPEKVYVDVVRHNPVAEEFTQHCKMSSPPVKTVYLAASEEEREKMLFEYSRSLMRDLNRCNIQIDNLKAWDKEQKKIYGGEDGQKKE